MYLGFPHRLIPFVRCSLDDGALQAEEINEHHYGRIWQATFTCADCGHRYQVVDGVLHMLDYITLSAQSEMERNARDEIAARDDMSWEQEDWSQMEVQPTIEASEPLLNSLVLELGAGTGRCTVEMARRGASVLAVDFSRASLATLAARCEPAWEIGLVWADCTRLSTKRAAFQLVASTLMSNLENKAQRRQLLAIAAQACAPLGKFVFGTHFYGARSILRREVRSGYYDGAPIYRYLFRTREIKRETRAFFDNVSCRPMVVMIPFFRKLGLPTVKLSRIGEHIPGVNQFGQLLLIVAKIPRERALIHVDDAHSVSRVSYR